MSRTSPSRLFASVAMVGIATSGCDCRELRPLTPCTQSAVAAHIDVVPVKDVDLLFVVDDSGSMREEQAKLRAEFPAMVRALLSGDPTPNDPTDPVFPGVRSLRVAVVTSDMGVAGVGTTVDTAETRISSCGAIYNGVDLQRASYGDDGVFRTTGHSSARSGQVLLDCDADDDGADDTVTPPALSSYLTFDAPATGTPAPADVDEFVRRVACFTNVGNQGCAFEQPLESMLKALTPAADSSMLAGGTFFSIPGDLDGALGHLDDPATNGDWLRPDSLLAVVYVSDEDDCSSTDARVFDYDQASGPYADPYGALQSQTRCTRFEGDLVLPVNRYVEGLLARRRNDPSRLVFAAITGVPADLTDGVDAPAGVVEGTGNLEDVLRDPRMAYDYRTQLLNLTSGPTLVPNYSIRPACHHEVPGWTFDATANVTAGDRTLLEVVPTNAPSFTPIAMTGSLVAGSANVDDATVPVGSAPPAPGMTLEGPGVVPGTVITLVSGDPNTTGPYSFRMSRAATQNAPAASLVVGASYGPGVGQVVSGAGLPFSATVASVSGVGPYVVTLADPAGTTATGAPLHFAAVDVQATPARRAVAVAEGLREAEVSVTVQSICVDDFAPAMGRILREIQLHLDGSCLPRALNRNAENEVTCDVLATLPPNRNCADDVPASTLRDRVPTTDLSDVDGFVERCSIDQVPVVGGATVPRREGWFYDDFSSELSSCPEGQRISFTTLAKPHADWDVSIGCAQPVRDTTLALDVDQGCAADADCAFTRPGDEAAFVERYNLDAHGWVSGTTSLHCEDELKTCQIGCVSDGDCPGGYVCFDRGGASRPYCVNPTCGTRE